MASQTKKWTTTGRARSEELSQPGRAQQCWTSTGMWDKEQKILMKKKKSISYVNFENAPHLWKGCDLQKFYGIRVTSFQSINWISGIDKLYLVKMLEINGFQLLHVENWTSTPNMTVVIHMCHFRWYKRTWTSKVRWCRKLCKLELFNK